MQDFGEALTSQGLKCYHCGDECNGKSVLYDGKSFCCSGCKAVYVILQENDLCRYYTLDDTPGVSRADEEISRSKYDYLDDNDVKNKLYDSRRGNFCSVTFTIPSIHCSSCIWLLENLNTLSEAVHSSRVNFLRKEVSVNFDDSALSLKELVILLAKIGYEPEINLGTAEDKQKKSGNKSLYYKLGVAGFCFGNIMLLSFPEYLSLPGESDEGLKNIFSYLIILLSLPVFFYSASDYFRSALNSIKSKRLNIEVPLYIGIFVLFARSIYEILSHSDAGYMDSMAGLVFLLLLGKLFQSKTYDTLNFERNYKSYFPISVTIKDENRERNVPLSRLKTGNRIIVRNNELIPADSILFNGECHIDYSFVTGESEPIEKVPGEIIYAGGRQKGGAIELEVIKDVSQSYLTQLWNKDSYRNDKEKTFSGIADRFSRYFTPVIILIAVAGFLVWLPVSFHTAVNVFTAVLIVACPCALALSVPFTLGNTMRIFGKNKFYLKNSSVVESLASADTVIFDKTGTITKSGSSEVQFTGEDTGKELNSVELSLVKSLARCSSHPLSVRISDFIKTTEFHEVKDFAEHTGKGIEGTVSGYKVKMGTFGFATGGTNKAGKNLSLKTKVFLSIDGRYAGFFKIKNSYRDGLKEVIQKLEGYSIGIISGDNDGEKENLLKYFPAGSPHLADSRNSMNSPPQAGSILFNMSPAGKLDYIKSLQDEERKVLMIGDGLNDAGALNQSNAGISIAEDINNFTPASDGILESGMFKRIASLIVFSKSSLAVIKISFFLSILYNITGLSLAVQGLLNPLTAAVLMPLSSVSVVTFAVLATNYLAKKRGLL